MSKEDKQGLMIIGILLLLGVSAFALSYKLKANSYTVDSASMCLENEIVKFNKIILIDKSDKWDSANIEKIESWLSKIDENVPMNSRLNIFSIGSNSKNVTEVKKIFDKCSPGNESDCHALYENCRDIRRKYDKAFQKPLEEMSELLASPTEAKNSPLFETIISIVDGIESEETEIHIVSDFIENGYKFNFYKEIPQVEQAIKEYNLSSESKITIYLYVIERRKHKVEFLNEIKSFWKGYFQKQGLEVKELKRFFISN